MGKALGSAWANVGCRWAKIKNNVMGHGGKYFLLFGANLGLYGGFKGVHWGQKRVPKNKVLHPISIF